jgi:hypothetical protein
MAGYKRIQERNKRQGMRRRRVGGCRSGSLLDRRMFLDLLTFLLSFAIIFPAASSFICNQIKSLLFFPPAVLVLAAFIRILCFILGLILRVSVHQPGIVISIIPGDVELHPRNVKASSQ